MGLLPIILKVTGFLNLPAKLQHTHKNSSVATKGHYHLPKQLRAGQTLIAVIIFSPRRKIYPADVA